MLAALTGLLTSSPILAQDKPEKPKEAKPPAQASLGLTINATPDQRGVRVTGVRGGGAGDKAGIRVGDIILSVEEKDVKATRDVIDVVRSKQPGNPLKLRLLRSGKEETLTATLGEMPVEPTPPDETPRGERAWLGVVLQEVRGGQGVTVARVYPNGPAAQAGLRPGDVILKADNQQIANPNDLIRKVGGMKPGQKISLTLRRDNKEQTVEATLANQRRFFRM